jgi:hypothetical protein
MRFFWLILLSAVLLAACAPQVRVGIGITFSDKEATPLVEESVVEVAVLPDNLVFSDLAGWGKPKPPGQEAADTVGDPAAVYRLVEELCDKIEQEAWKQASGDLLQGFVREGRVLQPAERSAQVEIFHEGSRLTGYCQPLWDELSGKFTHDVRFAATLLPLRRFTGEIDMLHDGYTMAGMGSRAYVTLTDPTGLSAPLPALIVQPQEGLLHGLVTVIGSGVITQIFGAQGQMEILESTKEIVAGDMFFVLQVQGQFVQERGLAAPRAAPYSPGMWRGLPAVIVHPAAE